MQARHAAQVELRIAEVSCDRDIQLDHALAVLEQRDGIAVAGATGAAQAAASVSLLAGGIEQLPRIFVLLRRARAVMRQNLFWALAYNLAAIPLAVTGFVHPALAALAMSLSSLTVLLNTLRLRG